MTQQDSSPQTLERLRIALRENEARIRNLSRLFAVSSAVNEAIVRLRDPQRLYHDACRIAVEQGELSFAWIAVRESQDSPLVVKSMCGGDAQFAAEILERINSTPAHPGPAGRALREGVVTVANDIATDATFYAREQALALGMRSCAVLPMRQAGKIYGVMAIYSRQPEYFQDEELRVLTALAANIAFAVESSEREQARASVTQALKENRRILRTLMDNLPGMTYRRQLDDNWTYEFASVGSLELTGYAPEQLIGNRFISFERVIAPADRQMVRETVERGLFETGSFQVIYRIVTAQGQQKWVWERGAGIYENSRLQCIEGFITDITAWRRAEQKVEAQAALLDKTNDAIVLFSVDGEVLYWNRGAERMYGWSSQEAVGQTLTALTCRDNDARRKIIDELFARDEWAGELPQRTKAGAEMTVDASWTLVRDERGAPQSILAVNTDVTERKQLEARIIDAQRLESLGTLAGGIAHDFNNILAAIVGNAKVLSHDLPEQHALRVHAREIEKAGRRASELVQQILAFSRQQQSSQSVVNAAELVEESLSMLRAMLPKQVEIRASGVDRALHVLADATQLQQVIVNLGVNAAHAMEGGGVLTVSVEGARIGAQRPADLLGELAPGRYARIAVSDTGVGIDPAMRARIFEPFFTTKPAGQGVGLGLAVAHGIVRTHGGAIGLHSAVGQGSTFLVYLPLTQPAHVETAAPEAVEPSDGRGQRVLYVDDEEALVFLTKRVLERMGYQVTGSVDAFTALEEFRSDPARFDAVITDLSMPGMTGPDLARAIKGIRPNMPVVMTSGFVRDQDLAAARELGIDELILKPNTVEELGAAVHRVLSHTPTSN